MENRLSGRDDGIRAQYDWGWPSGLLRGVGADFQAAHHEVHQRFPGFEVDVVHERADVLEEGFAGGQFGADEAVGLVAVGQEGVGEQGEHIHGGQQAGQMLLAVAEVVFEVVTLGLEGVVVFVLLLSDPTAGHRRIKQLSNFAR